MFSVEVPRLRRKKKFERVERDVIHDRDVSLWVRVRENAKLAVLVHASLGGGNPGTYVYSFKGVLTSPPRLKLMSIY